MAIGQRRAAKMLLLPLLFLVLLAFVNGKSFVAADDDLGDDSEDNFPDPLETEDDPSESSTPSQLVPLPEPVPTAEDPLPSVPSPSPSPFPLPPPSPSSPSIAVSPPATVSQPPKPLSTVPSGVLKAGTPSVECAVIADLYKATGPWQFVPDTANCCNTEYPNSSGIKCNANGQIVYIYLADLSHNRLSGSLPSSAPGWINMGTLNLEQNALTGPLPEWVTTLPNLHSLAIGQNEFTTGDAPPAFTFNLEPVIAGAAGANTSNIPPSVSPATYVAPPSTFLDLFTRLPKLKQLKLDSLGLSGGFPTSWQQKMVNLTKLDLSNNSMQGPIPDYINGFTGLKTLLLDRNEFGGPIPSLSSLKSLAVLDLSFNQLSGPLPAWTAGLNLTIVNLSNNLLSGSLPLDNHHAWRVCSVANNYFMCTKGPEQVLSAKWKIDCRAQCFNVQPSVPQVRPPVNTTLPSIKVHQSHNSAVHQAGHTTQAIGWSCFGAAMWFLSALL
ncbi:hypothetical protein EDD11_006468 [Mortierella claussenii]|nr:hypothetical protein EDD11_006468 [Mortierella claussenii]